MYGITWFRERIIPDILIKCVYNTDNLKLKEKLEYVNKYYESFISQTVVKTDDIRDTINIDSLYEKYIKYQKIKYYDNIKIFCTKESLISCLCKLLIPIDETGINVLKARFIIPSDEELMPWFIDKDHNYIVNYGFTVFGNITVPIVNFITQSILKTTESRDRINLNLLHDEFIAYHDKKWKNNKKHHDCLYLNSDIMIKIIFDPWLIANGYKIITENEGKINEEKYITNARFFVKPNTVLEYYSYNRLAKIEMEMQIQQLKHCFLGMIKDTHDMRDKIDINMLYDKFISFLHSKKGKYIDELDKKSIDKNSFTLMLSRSYGKCIDKEEKYIHGVRFEPSVENYYLGDYDYRIRQTHSIYEKYGSLHTLDVIDPNKYENIYTVPIINFIAHNLIRSEQVKDELDLNLIYERFNSWHFYKYEKYNAIDMDIFTKCLISNEYNISGQIIKNARYEPKTLHDINKHRDNPIEDYIPQIIFDAFMEYYKTSDYMLNGIECMHNIFIKWYIDKFNDNEYPELISFMKFLNRNHYESFYKSTN